MMKKSGFGAAIFILSMSMLVSVGHSADETLAQKCSTELTKVTECVPFATAKAAVPTKDCCEAVSDIKDADPVCLCFLIQQIHNGSVPALKSMGLQEARLLQLPSECKLTNASIAECPRLLHLPPNSTDAAIFTNGTSNSTAVTTPTPTPASTMSLPVGGSSGAKPQVLLPLLAAAAVFFHAAISTNFMVFT